MPISKPLKISMLVGALISGLLVGVHFVGDPVIPPQPREYDIEKLNAMVAAKGPRPAEPTTLQQWKTVIVDDMMNFLKDVGGEDYTAKEVAECGILLDRYISEITRPDKQGDKQHVLATSKTLVLSLNQLNARCNHSLIETMERESLCEMIFFGARQAGYPGKAGFDNDFTAEWREW